ncbi:MAG: ABC transporter substrate-binding protein [Afipia sp.]|nr:ABC transporter substrate-binding protein [Afipia sp.]
MSHIPSRRGEPDPLAKSSQSRRTAGRLSRCVLLGVLAASLGFAVAPGRAQEQEIIRIGLILPMTGPEAATGEQIDNAVRLYLEQNGDTIDGRKIEIVLRDDRAVPDETRQAAKELIADDKVALLAGFGTSPAAAIAAPLATEAAIPQVVMGAGTSLITDRSPFIVRSGGTLAQSAATLAHWAAGHELKKVAILIADYAPGNDALAVFGRHFRAAGGEIAGEWKAPLSEPDFAPLLEQIKEAAADALFVFVPTRQSRLFMEQFRASGLKIQVIGTGELTDDDALANMGEDMLGVITAHFYSAAHPSQENRNFVAAYRAAYGDRPGYMAVAGYDGMHLICQALRKTRGRTDGAALLAAMKGMAWESPRGPVEIDPQTREVIQNIYLRKVAVERGENRNIEFATVAHVKDPDRDEGGHR